MLNNFSTTQELIPNTTILYNNYHLITTARVLCTVCTTWPLAIPSGDVHYLRQHLLADLPALPTRVKQMKTGEGGVLTCEQSQEQTMKS